MATKWHGFRKIGSREHGTAFIAVESMLIQISSMMILAGHAPQQGAIAYLKSLPESDDEIVEGGKCFATHDKGQMMSVHNHLWTALAHEKVGLASGALRFCRLATRKDLAEGASPHTWTRSLGKFISVSVPITILLAHLTLDRVPDTRT